jgi:uncharacterized protein (DUF362 family)
MNRRDFLRATALAGTYVAAGGIPRALAAGGTPDLVAVRGGEPAAMFDRAIEARGGMKAFVKKGQKVLVKPNIGWDVEPVRAGNTNPQLVARIVEQCLAAGASEVYVFDNTCDPWQRTYRTSGIEAAARGAGAKVAPGQTESYYHPVTVAGAVLKQAKVHELLLQADVFINVPILKHHASTEVTAGLKNLMGVVWDRAWFHRNDLEQCIADMTAFRKADLTVIDAYNVLRRNGPRGVSVADVVQMKALLLSADPVAADAAAVKLLGHEPRDIGHLQLAARAGRGRMDLEALDIRKIALGP